MKKTKWIGQVRHTHIYNATKITLKGSYEFESVRWLGNVGKGEREQQNVTNKTAKNPTQTLRIWSCLVMEGLVNLKRDGRSEYDQNKMYPTTGKSIKVS